MDYIRARAKEVWIEHKAQKSVEKQEKPKTIFHVILQRNLPESEKTLIRLQEEAFILIVAGGETTARATTTLLAHLLQDQELSLRLRNELDKVIRSELPTSRALEDIPLMKAMVQEGLRISAPVSNRPMLIAPNEDLRYKDWINPRGTSTSMTLSNILFDPTIFHSPQTFDPDRWLRAAEQNLRLDRHFVTFSKGARSCIGINIAYTEIYLAVAALVSKFELSLHGFDYKRDVEITRDNFIGLPRKESRGVRVKVEVRKE